MATQNGVTRRKPGKGRVFTVLGDLIACKLVGEECGDAFSVFEITVQPFGGPPPHIHLHEEEAYYVLEGKFEFVHGEITTPAETGAFVHFSRGVLHTYKNVGNTPGRLLAIYSPAGVEHYFEEMDRISRQSSADPDEVKQVAMRHAIVARIAG